VGQGAVPLRVERRHQLVFVRFSENQIAGRGMVLLQELLAPVLFRRDTAPQGDELEIPIAIDQIRFDQLSNSATQGPHQVAQTLTTSDLAGSVGAQFAQRARVRRLENDRFLCHLGAPAPVGLSFIRPLD